MTEGKLFTICSEKRKMVVNGHVSSSAAAAERYHLENSPSKRRPSVVSLAFEIKKSASVMAAVVSNASQDTDEKNNKCSSCSKAITGFIEKCFYW